MRGVMGMKGMALETVVKWIILTAVVLIVINLMSYYSEKIKSYINLWVKGEDRVRTKKVERERFSTPEVMTYVRSCWGSTGEDFYEDVICYILSGDVSEVDVDLLLGAVDYPAVVNTTSFDRSMTMTIIRFEDVGNIIYVES